MSTSIRLYGIGVGPGDPELMTLKAARLLREADFVAYFAKAGRESTARTIAAAHLTSDTQELPLYYPVTTEIHFAQDDYRARLRAFYAEAATTIAALLEDGKTGVLLCEGDPLFYGSFMHIFVRLRERFPAEIVPGISGMAGAWSAARLPITWGDDVLSVVPATLPAAQLLARLEAADAAVVMKLGRNLPKVRQALAAAGLLERAIYVEYATRAAERILPLSEKDDDDAPYFALVLVAGQGRRP